MVGPRHASPPARQTAPALSYVGIAALGIVVVLAAATPIPWSITTRFEPLNTARNYTPTPLPNSGTLPPEQTVLERVVPAWTGTVFWTLVFLALWSGRLLASASVVAIAAPTARWTSPPSQAPCRSVSRPGCRGAARRVPVRPWSCWTRFPIRRTRSSARGWPWSRPPRPPAHRGARPTVPPSSPVRFLRSTAADPEAVTRLLGLYHRARFSDHPVGMAEVKQARACVLSLCRTWSGYEDALRSSVHLRHSVRQSSSVRTGPASRR